MKLTSITVRAGETINTGNYNNAKYEIEASAEIAEGDDADACYQQVKDWVLDKVLDMRANVKGGK